MTNPELPNNNNPRIIEKKMTALQKTVKRWGLNPDSLSNKALAVNAAVGVAAISLEGIKDTLAVLTTVGLINLPEEQKLPYILGAIGLITAANAATIFMERKALAEQGYSGTFSTNIAYAVFNGEHPTISAIAGNLSSAILNPGFFISSSSLFFQPEIFASYQISRTITGAPLSALVNFSIIKETPEKFLGIVYPAIYRIEDWIDNSPNIQKLSGKIELFKQKAGVIFQKGNKD